MKNYFYFIMFAVITAFTSFSLTSCGDDDDNSGGGGNEEDVRVAVDLGLPSGTKWANHNIGASSESDNGDYFAWGEIAPKSNYSWSTYAYAEGPSDLTKYCSDSHDGKNGFTDTKTELDLNDDVAHKLWGGSWRMPTEEQLEELLTNTTSKWVKRNGKLGRLFTGTNGNSIFLPAAGSVTQTSIELQNIAGQYWSRTLYTVAPNRAMALYFNNQNILKIFNAISRAEGVSVRPVCP